MTTILHYLVLIFVTLFFTILYFKFLKFSLDKVLSKEKSFNYIYVSFLTRFCLTLVFFYMLLKYYHDIQEILLVIIVFLICRYFILRNEKKFIKKEINEYKP